MNGARSSPWHAMSPEAVFQTVESREGGLAHSEAQARLGRVGPNRLPQARPTPWWAIALRQFRSPLIYVLGAAAAVSAIAGHGSDAVFIGAVLCLNALIGAIQESRAERSSLALQKLLKVRATVVRDGEAQELDAEQLVPGDVVWIESGNRVPADVRLIGAQGLKIDESLLTGESMAVSKEAAALPAASAESIPLADRRNVAHAGTIVARGRGEGVVVATGESTAVGQLARDMATTPRGKAPLVERMERFGRTIGIVVVAAALVIAVIGVTARGYGMQDMLMFGVALAVSAVPEGLPVALTVVLAIAMTRMSRRGVIVRRLAAVEGLGSCTLIASDKTGTLTCNEMTVREIRLADGQAFTISGEGFAPDGQVLREGRPVEPDDRAYATLQRVARAAVLCNEGDLHRSAGNDVGWAWRGDPTDVALLSMAHKLGWVRENALGEHPQINEIPFEPEHKFAASYHTTADGPLVLVKGAPERLIPMCELPDDGPGSAATVAQIAQGMAARGLRVLAVAEGPAPAEIVRDASRVPPEPSGLTLLGFVAMIDPLRAGVHEAVRACHAAGIDVWMVTGDHPVTALAIARDLGLASAAEQVVTGPQLAEHSGLSPRQFWETIRGAKVFARVSPQQKLQIVRAARAAGQFVAVTGDGANDAPALRAANIGVAMGRGGTDVAREAAELVIADDNFATIVAGVHEGRVAYNNIRNLVFLLASTGAAEVVLAAFALVGGLPLPLLPVQLLLAQPGHQRHPGRRPRVRAGAGRRAASQTPPARRAPVQPVDDRADGARRRRHGRARDHRVCLDATRRMVGARGAQRPAAPHGPVREHPHRQLPIRD